MGPDAKRPAVAHGTLTVGSPAQKERSEAQARNLRRGLFAKPLQGGGRDAGITRIAANDQAGLKVRRSRLARNASLPYFSARIARFTASRAVAGRPWAPSPARCFGQLRLSRADVSGVQRGAFAARSSDTRD